MEKYVGEDAFRHWLGKTPENTDKDTIEYFKSNLMKYDIKEISRKEYEMNFDTEEKQKKSYKF